MVLGRASRLQQTSACLVHAPIMSAKALCELFTAGLESAGKVGPPRVRVSGGTHTSNDMAEPMEEASRA